MTIYKNQSPWGSPPGSGGGSGNGGGFRRGPTPPNLDEAIKKAENVIKSIPETYKTCWLNMMRKKLALVNKDNEDENIIIFMGAGSVTNEAKKLIKNNV